MIVTPPIRQQAESPAPLRRTPRRRLATLALLGCALVGCLVLSLLVGSSAIPLGRVWELLQHPDDSYDSYVVNTLRVTRTFIGFIVGLSLAVAGAVMQAVTRNPLADPGLLGVNSGAALGVVLGASVGGLTSFPAQFLLAAVGALVATFLVFSVGSWAGDGSPVRLVLAGVAFSAAAGGLIQAILLTNPQAFDTFRFWDVGALTRSDSTVGYVVIPVLLGLALVLIVSRGLANIALGDDIAAALGTKVARVRAVSILALTLLCASATAIAGPIGFVGLMVPLAVAWLLGPARGWILAVSAVAGPVLVLSADILGRLLARPSELQVGLLTAFVGSPVLLFMVFRLRGDAR
ncbi:FecCD family ABC transporter permease [Leucobacter sp. M11]|uniref:FecCD family ABC transporter permease n=1 Tax=Leucobacter sp. M11 TaxID=2993565 RepID=UPI002D8061B7|nr:iron chelate uptake ABC transporter family permease subunit [Leucobacter sp. M11]MEB4616325.1 iron chelate uptake ABC transporter family permease subunit [Leucobacter sp. M11]